MAKGEQAAAVVVGEVVGEIVGVAGEVGVGVGEQEKREDGEGGVQLGRATQSEPVAADAGSQEPSCSGAVGLQRRLLSTGDTGKLSLGADRVSTMTIAGVALRPTDAAAACCLLDGGCFSIKVPPLV